ncbi:MAG: hypothetical protein VYC34_02435 [Planctomycetota bacterium]|nr:hypothetical protein [Planctomycetota bacterium]
MNDTIELTNGNDMAAPAMEGGGANAALAKISELEEALSTAQSALERSERSRSLEVALLQAETIDLETARLVSESVLEQMKEGDAAAAVAEVKRRKPHLFRQKAPSPSAAMSPAAEGEGGALRAAAEQAAASGDRTSVLRYLRLKRTK